VIGLQAGRAQGALQLQRPQPGALADDAVTAIAFLVVVGLMTSMRALVNGMYRLTEASGHAENVLVLTDAPPTSCSATWVTATSPSGLLQQADPSR
jgi:hypothetical protein